MLESVENGEQVGRYTFIGLAPFKRIVARGRDITITEGKKVVQIEGDIFAVLRRALSGHKPARLQGLPPFTAGAVGFFPTMPSARSSGCPSWPRMNWAFVRRLLSPSSYFMKSPAEQYPDSDARQKTENLIAGK